ncbi:hypothetical protein [uncultured Tateyamaria sp.]|uniref:hypothetical protein n=1 Tax=uncultured Tateyamaria sp. TaxID=455651 RepID=UPI00261BD668|nr:hypothetical protein [uncultured Tateyamaria sp.]
MALRSAGQSDLVHAGAHALNVLRLERGFRSWGHDMGPRDTSLEAASGFAVAWPKNQSFRGRDALLRQRARGLTRRLVSLTTDMAAWPHGHKPIYRNGQLAGGGHISGLFAHAEPICCVGVD